MEERLTRFFSEVGRLHASNVLQDVASYVPLMKQHPQIAEQEVHRFRHYFTEAPAHNHLAALKCLIIIATEIPPVRPRIIENLGSILYEYRPIWKGLPEVYGCLNELLEVLELPLSGEDEYVRNLARSIITHRQPLVLIIGAGFSYDTMPVTSEIQPLLVQLLREVGISSPMQMIRKNDEQVWRIVKDNSARFKDMFSGWCARTHPAPQHKIVAKMLHDSQISHLISFNWDDLIERAYMDEFGESVSKVVNEGSIPERASLWKLHGDVTNLSGEWVFPYGQGYVLNNLIESLERTIARNCPQFVLIVGYSEWEKVVHARLVRPLEDNIPTVLRVRPNWDEKDPGGIRESAKRFFERLKIYFEMEAKSH
jgi:hypothetical protein